MNWDYRTVNHGSHYAIHEIYYDENGDPEFYSNAMSPFGETFQELQGDLGFMGKAFEKPVIELSDLEKLSEVTDVQREEVDEDNPGAV